MPHAAYYARLASTLDRVSHGRLLLNIVVGGSAQELAGDGIFLPHDERYDHADEFFQVFNSLIETGKGDLDGKYIKAQGARLGLPPVQEPRPPLYFGGSSDAGIEFSAGITDKYLTWGEPCGTGGGKNRQGSRRRSEKGARSDIRHSPAFHRARNR